MTKILLDCRDRIAAGIDRYAMNTLDEILPELLANRCEVGILVERHQLSRVKDHPGAVMLLAPWVERFIRFDDEVLLIAHEFRADYLHSFGPYVDPRMAPNFSATVHDLTRLHVGRATLYSDQAFRRRYGEREYANLARSLDWMNTRVKDFQIHRYAGKMESYIQLHMRYLIEHARFISILSPSVLDDIVKHAPGRQFRYHLHKPVTPEDKFYVEDARNSLARLNPLSAGEFILFVGNPDHHKRLDLIVDWLDGLSALASFPARKVIVVGDRAGENLFERLGIEVECARIERWGHVSDDVLRALYQHARFTVIPSLNEGYGFPLDEALQCGGYVVASDIAVLRNKVSRQDPVAFFDLADPESFVTAIRMIEDLRMRGSSGGRRRATSLSADLADVLLKTASCASP